MSATKEKTTGTSLRALGAQELQAQLVDKSEALRRARFQHALKQLPKTHTLKALRRSIAQLKGALSAQAGAGKENA